MSVRMIELLYNCTLFYWNMNLCAQNMRLQQNCVHPVVFVLLTLLSFYKLNALEKSAGSKLGCSHMHVMTILSFVII